jgi:hypothetical protein
MHQSITTSCAISDFCSQYGDYLFRVRELAAGIGRSEEGGKRAAMNLVGLRGLPGS